MKFKPLELSPWRFLFAQKLRRKPRLHENSFFFSPRQLQKENANNFAFNFNESNAVRFLIYFPSSESLDIQQQVRHAIAVAFTLEWRNSADTIGAVRRRSCRWLADHHSSTWASRDTLWSLSCHCPLGWNWSFLVLARTGALCLVALARNSG